MNLGVEPMPELATVDLEKKRIYLRFIGFLSAQEASELKEAYRAAIAKVGRDYTVVTIFENFTPGTAEVQETISSMILMASNAGCRKAATKRNPLPILLNRPRS